MTKDEHLLMCLAEECAEVAHRVSKVLRFGLNDVEPGQVITNKQRLTEELFDLVAVATLCERRGFVYAATPSEDVIQRKRDKIERHLHLSRTNGTLSE